MSSTLSTIEVEAPAAPAPARTQPAVQPAETAANPSTVTPGWSVAAWVVCSAAFAVAFLLCVLFPAIATLVGAGGP